MKIVFIAVNYNNAYMSINYAYNVLSLKNIDKHEIEIYIVDNDSKQEDYEKLSSALDNIDKVKIMQTGKNLGYFGGINYGLKQIDTKTYDYVIVGNNDLIFEYNILERLEEKEYDSKYSVIVPDLANVNGSHQNPQFYNHPSKFRQFCYALYYTNYTIAKMMNKIFELFGRRRTELVNVVPESGEIFLPIGAVFFLRNSFFEHCGLLNDELFLWGEEVAIAHQVEEAKDKIYYDNSLIVHHIGSTSVNKINAKRTYEMSKKSYKIYKKWY